MAERLDDLVMLEYFTHMTKSQLIMSMQEEWIYAKLRIGEEDRKFVVSSCDIINHFVEIDSGMVFRKMLAIAKKVRGRL